MLLHQFGDWVENNVTYKSEKIYRKTIKKRMFYYFSVSFGVFDSSSSDSSFTLGVIVHISIITILWVILRQIKKSIRE